MHRGGDGLHKYTSEKSARVYQLAREDSEARAFHRGGEASLKL